MWMINKGCKLKNIIDDNGHNRNYYQGDILPKSFIPHQTWIDQKIVVKIEKNKNLIKSKEVLDGVKDR